VLTNTIADRDPTPLMSNNPFRSRIGSNSTNPSYGSQAYAQVTQPASRNPFLDATEIIPESQRSMPPSNTNDRAPTGKSGVLEDTTEVLVSDCNMNDMIQSDFNCVVAKHEHERKSTIPKQRSTANHKCWSTTTRKYATSPNGPCATLE